MVWINKHNTYVYSLQRTQNKIFEKILTISLMEYWILFYYFLQN